MKCATHPLVDSVAYCGQCGRALCGDCKREVRGMIYCENCLAVRLQPSTLPPLWGRSGEPSPGVALGLGFIPGVGAIYNGQVVKGIVQVLIFGSLIALTDKVGGPMDTIFVLGAIAFYFYMVVDSYQTARRKLYGLPAEEWFGLGDAKLNAPLGAALLIGLGALFLLDNLGVPVFQHISKFWPVLLIVIGVILLQRRIGGSGTSSSPGGGPPGAPKEGAGHTQGPQST